MKRFQKAVVSCALALTLVNPARGAVGASFAAPVAVVMGVAAMGVAAAGGYGSYRLFKAHKPVLGGAVGVLSLGMGYFGFLLLDGEQEAKFTELTADAAESLKVSAADIEIYNSEVEQVNAIAREIGEELADDPENVERSKALWAELGSQLSPETMKTVIAIASSL